MFELLTRLCRSTILIGIQTIPRHKSAFKILVQRMRWADRNVTVTLTLIVFQTLSDKEKRAVYDRSGEEGLKKMGGGGGGIR